MYGKKIKKHKYYFCATWFIYESFMLLSIVAYIDVIRQIWPFDLWRTTFLNVGRLSCFIIFWMFYFAFWIWHSLNHIRLIQQKCFGVSKFIDMNCIDIDYNFLLIERTRKNEHGHKIKIREENIDTLYSSNFNFCGC